MAKCTITIKQGKTYRNVLRWEAKPFVYKAISGITQTGPATITATGHGIPDGWRVMVESVKGMAEINSDQRGLDKWSQATVVDANTVELNDINASSFKAYKSGGYLKFYTPVDLDGFTCRAVIKDAIGATLWSGNPTIDNTAKTVTIEISAADTAAMDFSRGVIEVEIESSGGEVTQLLMARVVLEREILV